MGHVSLQRRLEVSLVGLLLPWDEATVGQGRGTGGQSPVWGPTAGASRGEGWPVQLSCRVRAADVVRQGGAPDGSSSFLEPTAGAPGTVSLGCWVMAVGCPVERALPGAVFSQVIRSGVVVQRRPERVPHSCNLCRQGEGSPAEEGL